MTTLSWYNEERAATPSRSAKTAVLGHVAINGRVLQLTAGVWEAGGRVAGLVIRYDHCQPDEKALSVSLKAEVWQGTGFAAECSSADEVLTVRPGTSYQHKWFRMQPRTHSSAVSPAAPLCIRVTISACTAQQQLDIGDSVQVAGGPAQILAAYGSSKFSDCTIKLSDGSELPAHRQAAFSYANKCRLTASGCRVRQPW
jgi:hypothetical protein